MDYEQARDWFLAALRKVLQDLYDPRELRASPLVQVFGLQGDPAPALRRVIFDAIQSLQPGGDVPPHAQAWRIHQILTYRYLEQSSQAVVASNLGLSIRQLRRQERVAESVLADTVWDTHQLGQAVMPVSAEHLQPPPETGESDLDRESELAWLQRSLPSETVHLGTVIESALRTVTPLARQLGVEMTADMPVGLPPVVGGEALLRQALLSLLTAATRAAPGGQVEIAAAYADAALCLEVRSRAAVNGMRVAEATGEPDENLSMARELVELMGGRLHVEDEGEASAGLTVQLRLPPAERIAVLAVDDNADALKLYERYLATSQYRLIGTPDPHQALTLAEQIDPAAILLDVMLPDIDGWELLGRLREHPVTAGIPVIICTILPQEQLALALGAAAFIRKPVTREGLLSALDQWGAGEAPRVSGWS